MPDNRAKLQFNAAYLARIDKAVQNTQLMLKAIQPKLRAGRKADADRAVSALWVIKQYAYINIKAIPFSDAHTILKHDELSVRRIRNSKQSLKVLFQTLLPDKQKIHKGGYAAALDLFNQFETTLTEIVLALGSQ
jgi:hypothetical protein